MSGDGIGTCVATYRKLAGLTQDQLAQHSNYSRSTTRAVKQGREPASPAFTAAVARVLRVEPEELTGAPYRDTLEDDEPLERLPDLRAILAEGSYVAPVQPEPPDTLAAEMNSVNAVYHNARGHYVYRRYNERLSSVTNVHISAWSI